MGVIFDKLMKLTRQFYPTGRAFNMPKNGYFESLQQGLALSEERAYIDINSILSNILPDNANFTIEDVRDWERRLGLITNESVSLSDRKQAIYAKMAFPGNVKARQAGTWIERQLQAAGFDVYVYENLTGISPFDFSSDPSVLQYVQYGDVQYGDQMYGKYYTNKVVNKIDPEGDRFFNEGGSFRASFFIGGPTEGSFANVDINRLSEFRQLILRTKPAQDVAFLFINFV
jgi:hypothetical protein